MKWIRKYAWCLWLGIGPGLLFDYGIETWEWWVFTFVLVGLVQIDSFLEIFE